MTQYHEGQEVMAAKRRPYKNARSAIANWRNAKIAGLIHPEIDTGCARDRYVVEFADGTRGVFDADHIRAVSFLSRPVRRAAREAPASASIGGNNENDGRRPV